MSDSFSEESKAELKKLMDSYPDRMSAVMNALHLAQREFGHISYEALEALSKEMELPVQQLEDTASFYTMYFKEPVGENVIWVCQTLPCALRGSADIFDYLKEKLDIDAGETTSDKRFTLMKAECLASCGTAPMMQVNDDYFEDLTEQKIDKILGKFD
ncbi:MAG: NAD(P)H-dependent oxidoreductase subunit E [Candidatus Marinimicrobia bacterium]|nr:NAD(P)H-dependent oxidoreductase subunit E [Candidatus Neomarinimicrobiota bacterium]